ncbi:MAG TPA: hypothetical protein VIM11_13245 [Tepidisphaeraceae bacterium]
MRRHFFTLASLLSLLLCAATAAMWVMSREAYCGLSLVDASKSDDARWNEWFTYRGKLGFAALRYRAGMTEIESFAFRGKHRRMTWLGEPPIMAQGLAENAEAGREDWQFAGFSYSNDSSAGLRDVLIPLWVISCLFAILPVLKALQTFMSRLQRNDGLCPVCSYNLTGNTSGICPECGTPHSPLSALP